MGKRRSIHWQQQLWKALFNQDAAWSYPCRELRRSIQTLPQCDLHFFSISFITSWEFLFYNSSAYLPICYYLLSPCAFFWSDIRSDKEATYLQTLWQQKLGHVSHVAKLEELLRDRNPLLANFGRLGREMACQIEEKRCQTKAQYALPDSVMQLCEDYQFIEDLTLVPSQQSLTLLQAIQADILLMRNPQGLQPINLSLKDHSIQLHVAPSRQREVQILYNNLLHLIDQNGTKICPSDIVIMAPQIMDYVPYIQSVFGSEDSLLDFQILDLGMRLQSEKCTRIFTFIGIGRKPLGCKFHLLQLFGHSAFQRRQKLTPSDYIIIRDWI